MSPSDAELIYRCSAIPEVAAAQAECRRLFEETGRDQVVSVHPERADMTVADLVTVVDMSRSDPR